MARINIYSTDHPPEQLSLLEIDNLKVGTGVTVYGNTGIVSAVSVYAEEYYGDGSNLENVGIEVSAIDTLNPDYPGTNSISNQITNVKAIRFDTDSGFAVSDLGDGAVQIALNSTFKYWEVDGQDTLEAEGLDTVKIIAGVGIAITTQNIDGDKRLTITGCENIKDLPSLQHLKYLDASNCGLKTISELPNIEDFFL